VSLFIVLDPTMVLFSKPNWYSSSLCICCKLGMSYVISCILQESNYDSFVGSVMLHDLAT
jgi:hypothetical protein